MTVLMLCVGTNPDMSAACASASPTSAIRLPRALNAGSKPRMLGSVGQMLPL
jgi:hypothetical protein